MNIEFRVCVNNLSCSSECKSTNLKFFTVSNKMFADFLKKKNVSCLMKNMKKN